MVGNLYWIDHHWSLQVFWIIQSHYTKLNIKVKYLGNDRNFIQRKVTLLKASHIVTETEGQDYSKAGNPLVFIWSGHA